MTEPLERDAIYLKRHFDAEIIVLCVRWYITYKFRVSMRRSAFAGSQPSLRVSAMNRSSSSDSS